MRFVGMAVVGLCCLLLASCGSSKPQDLIVGKWQLIHDQGGDPVVEEFTSDGKVFGYLGDRKTSERGYKFADDQTLEFLLGEGRKATYKVAVTSSELTLTRGDGEVEKFKRVR